MHLATHMDGHRPMMILMPAFSAAQLQEILTKQCSALAYSQASLQRAKASIQKRSTQKPLRGLTVFNMGLSFLHDFMPEMFRW